MDNCSLGTLNGAYLFAGQSMRPFTYGDPAGIGRQLSSRNRSEQIQEL
jgi:hypothetical protein